MSLTRFLIKTISTFFYIGFLPKMPGTFASIATVLLFLCVKGDFLATALLFLLSIIAGMLVSGKAEELFGKKDPGCVVIDEVSGMLASLLFIPFQPLCLLSALALFRFFDIAKPLGIKKLQKLPGSAGIMSDDLLAGLYTNLIIQLALKVYSWSAS